MTTEAKERTPDAKIKAARDGWMIRMVAGGVPVTDFLEVAYSIDRWDDWCQAWCERAGAHEKTGRACLADNQNASAALHLTTAAVEYHFAKFLFTHDVKQMKAAHAKAVECRTLALPHLSPPGERVAIPFEGRYLYGNLRKPLGATGKQAVILIISGMDSTKEEQHNYEQLFLERGLATLAFDGPGQGEGEYDWPIRHTFEEPVGAAIDWVEKRIDLDGDRVGISGSSMGGFYAPRAAAFEKRVKAAIANSGAYSVIENFDPRPPTLKDAYVLRTHSKTVDEAREKTRPFDMAGVASRITCPMSSLPASRTASRAGRTQSAWRRRSRDRAFSSCWRAVSMSATTAGTCGARNAPTGWRCNSASRSDERRERVFAADNVGFSMIEADPDAPTERLPA